MKTLLEQLNLLLALNWLFYTSLDDLFSDYIFLSYVVTFIMLKFLH